jgi:hypothetical protein
LFQIVIDSEKIEKNKMMATEKRIRVIKRAERNERRSTSTQMSGGRARHTAAATELEAAIVVNAWVRELRRKKGAEAEAAHRAIEELRTTGNLVSMVR